MRKTDRQAEERKKELSATLRERVEMERRKREREKEKRKEGRKEGNCPQRVLNEARVSGATTVLSAPQNTQENKYDYNREPFLTLISFFLF